MRHLRITLAGITAAAALAWAAPAFAATLYFDAPATVSAGENFTIKVLVDSGDKGFNAAEAAIAFPANILEVTSIDTAPASTAFNFWISLPSFANDKGLVRFSGGATHGLVGPAIQVLTVHMRAKGSGDATITASDASVNASDGSGTNILDSITARRITVRATQATPPPAIETPTQPKTPQPSATPAAPSTKNTTVCDGFFSNCDLPFPAITSVSVGPRQATGVAILVSGTGVAGDQIRLRLNRDKTLYARVYALVAPNGTWEATFSHILAYGSYTIEASTEDANHNLSQPAHWNSIHIFPPYTLYVFGTPLRWYLLVEIALVLVVVTASFGVAIRYRNASNRTHVLGRFLVINAAVVVVVSAVVLFFWYQEFQLNDGYWKDTNIPCVNQEHSFFDRYLSVSLNIYVNGVAQAIPANIGTSPQCVAAIHTHDNSGNLHIEPSPKGITLADFFTVAGETLKRPGYTVSVTINNADYTSQADTYVLEGGDTAVVQYTTAR